MFLSLKNRALDTSEKAKSKSNETFFLNLGCHPYTCHNQWDISAGSYQFPQYWHSLPFPTTMHELLKTLKTGAGFGSMAWGEQEGERSPNYVSTSHGNILLDKVINNYMLFNYVHSYIMLLT